MPKTYDRRQCMVCQTPILPYQVVSGVPSHLDRDGRIQQLYGHYHCVKERLGPAKVEQAVRLDLFPLLPDEWFNEAMQLKKLVRIAHERARGVERIYEFIGS